ncbi:hypothetical protein AAG570_007620 [Ranatra chinensis]|uniref:G-protein coupled receptors family 2 profile 2 domain-containing protein n=1 Tax=Ranatra chinensis TaxID=642074 RepID=A0ABD0XU18_9HEMI
MPMEEGTSKDMMVIYSYCLLVSVVFLIITFITYCMLPSLRDLQGRCVMCFVASLIISYTSLSITQLEFLGYEVPANTCVFAGHVETWVFFYGPMTILLLCNITFFFMTTIRLWQDYRNTTPQPRIRVLRFKYITDILNTLQGVIIFLIMVATRKRVLRALAKNKMCGTYFNENWQTMPDEESEVTTQREQIQLS